MAKIENMVFHVKIDNVRHIKNATKALKRFAKALSNVDAAAEKATFAIIGFQGALPFSKTIEIESKESEE